jgi:hypothetical protein
VYRHPITKEQITLTYQKTERNLPTISQKPDTTLSIEKKGKDFHYNYIFDAKYRIDFAVEGSYYQRHYHNPGPMEDDINTMHRYRDSLVVQQNGPFERTAFGAYVLFPWKNEEEYEHHHFYKSIDKVNIGALPFLPNATRLVEQFVEHLIEKSPEEIQAEGILPRGTKEEWMSALDDKVLVGVVSSEDDYRAHIQQLYYELPTSRLKKGWQEAKYVALYSKRGVALQNGVTDIGRIKEVKVDRKNSNEEEHIRFEIEVWESLKHIVKPVGYGISVYTMTTLNTLKKARELPEIFMKSKEEVALWRMIRRISDKVNVDLDEKYLDHANRVKQFLVKDISFKIIPEEKRLLIEKNEQLLYLEVYDLFYRPSGVFKEILKFLQ